ncbi:MAG TPA: zinc ribbon domain-containing protein [Vicinamibacterales bacterium]|nr:zinc ribbon domain-containing protein [Vicinamibacterales bacterium]
MSSEISTDARDQGFRVWHVYLLLAMAAATAAVAMSPSTHPAALLLLSAAIIAAGFAATAVHHALIGFLGAAPPAPAGDRVRASLEEQKAIVLRSIKELEFDRAMGKLSDADFAELSGRLRARALELMGALAAVPATPPTATAVKVGAVAGSCPNCHGGNDSDARFCKHCGAKLA